MSFFMLWGCIIPELFQHLLGETIKFVSFVYFFESLKEVLKGPASVLRVNMNYTALFSTVSGQFSPFFLYQAAAYPR